MSNSVFAIGETSVRQHDGLFSLNDLHAAAGGEAKHDPNRFIRLDSTQALIAEIQSSNAGIQAIETKRGAHGGTYACRELVIAYAAWINAAFHLKVIRVFLNAAVQPPVAATPMQDKTNAALEAANAVAAQVQVAVFKALMAGGKSWQNERWMLSFMVNGRDESVKPHAEQIESDAVVMPLPRLATSIRKEGDMLVSNAELANLASACSTRLAQRMQVATS